MSLLLTKTVDSQLYPSAAIEEATEKYGEQCTIKITTKNENHIEVSIESNCPETILEFWNYALECAVAGRI